MKKYNDTVPRLLIISLSYAPRLNPRAFRWTALAEEFTRIGARVQVVSAWQPGLLKNELINDVEIYRVGNRIVERIRYILSVKKGRQYKKLLKPLQGKNTFSFSQLSSKIWQLLAWPDTTSVWLLPALLKAKKLLQGSSNTTIIAVTPTFSAAIVGYLLNQMNSCDRWILDMGDPFSFTKESPPNNYLFYNALNRQTERVLFKSVSAITVTNSNTQRIYANLYPESATKLFVIPPLLNDTNYRFLKEPISPIEQHEPLRIVYVGSLYKQVRRPDFLLELFVGLLEALHPGKVELHIYGNTEECIESFTPYSNLLGRSIHLYGMVSQKRALKAIRGAAVVLNIGNSNEYQLPSKLVEYVAAGKPIVNICTCRGDASKKFLRNYHATLNLDDSGLPPSRDQVIVVADFIQKPPSEFVNSINKQWVKQFQISTIANKYANILFREQIGLKSN